MDKNPRMFFSAGKKPESFNKRFGKIVGLGMVKYAPVGVSDEELLANGWLPVIDNMPQPDDPDYVYVMTRWYETDGHIERQCERRKRICLRKKYSREKIAAAMGDRYQQLVSKLKDEHPALLAELEKSTVYFDGCGALSQVEKIYCEMFDVKLDDARRQVLDTAEIKNGKEQPCCQR